MRDEPSWCWWIDIYCWWYVQHPPSEFQFIGSSQKSCWTYILSKGLKLLGYIFMTNTSYLCMRLYSLGDCDENLWPSCYYNYWFKTLSLPNLFFQDPENFNFLSTTGGYNLRLIYDHFSDSCELLWVPACSWQFFRTVAVTAACNLSITYVTPARTCQLRFLRTSFKLEQ